MTQGSCLEAVKSDGPQQARHKLFQDKAWCLLIALMSIPMVFSGRCAGPQALSIAIDPRDQDAYVSRVNNSNGNAKLAYVEWMAAERDSTPDQVLHADAVLSQTRNPFDGRNDRRAVSRGAVLYQVHCARCHGDDATGHGPSTLPDYPATDFKTFGKRLGAAIHRGAPRKWFRVIRDGSGDLVDYPDGRTAAMPAFGDQLTREQMWLVITYLQSLDVDAVGGRSRS